MNPKLVLEVRKVGNGYIVQQAGCPNDELADTMLAEDGSDVRLYLEAWLALWLEANKVEKIREVT